jgi:phenylalanyl-tRNA synthetase beta chain
LILRRPPHGDENGARPRRSTARRRKRRAPTPFHRTATKTPRAHAVPPDDDETHAVYDACTSGLRPNGCGHGTGGVLPLGSNMRVSYNWLRELLPELTLSAGEVADRLNGVGLAVDRVTPHGAALEQVRLARVVALEPHPKRSGLRLVTIEHGRGTQRLVCGAANVPEPGGMVVLAPLGARLPSLPEPLAPREIGGVLSEGMLVSETELGLASAADGIIVLPADSAEPGRTLAELVPTGVDTIFELDVTPNRPDALGHVGVARDLAALLALRAPRPTPAGAVKKSSVALASLVSVENRDTERCPHYGAGAVLDVTVGPSPLWLRWRLESLGVRAISNVVDVTNLILFEFGQPMHAFDLDRLRGSRIVVRRATPDEPFTTLDGVARKLDADDLVIADGDVPSALAGIMGGQDSEIRATTRRVLLECAYFQPRGVRRTARRHGLHTESSHRFERGVDFGAVPAVLERAKELLAELSGGSVVEGAIHAQGPKIEPPRIRLRSSRLDALLGVPVPFDQAVGMLERLGFAVAERSGSGASAAVEVLAASHRPDVAIEVDLVDEVSRLRGLDAIPTRLPAVAPQPPRRTGELERRVLDLAQTLGLSEALTYAFVDPADLRRLQAPEAAVTLKNPLGEERSVMRTTLLPGLLSSLARARRRGEAKIRLFSLGATFHAPVLAPTSGARPRLAEDVGSLPSERLEFAALLAGPRLERLALDPPEVDVYDAKALAVELVERLTSRTATVRHATATNGVAHLHPRGAGLVLVGDSVVGRFGPLHPDVVDAFELGGQAQVVELDLEELDRLGTIVPRFRTIPRLPAVTRDVSLVVGEELEAGRIAAVLVRAGGELCESIEIAAEFRGGSLPAGSRSLTFRVVYRDPKARLDAGDARTLTDQEVDAVATRMLEAARTELGATLRA